MLITSKHLQGACEGQIDLFNKIFPDGAEFNKTNWDLALRVGLLVLWMETFLYGPARKIYKETKESAWKIYEEVEESARKIYDEETAPASKTYGETTKLAWKRYDEETESANEIYHDSILPAWNMYKDETVSAWKKYEDEAVPAWKIYDEAIKSVLFNALEKQFSAKKKLSRSLMEYLKWLIRFFM